MIRDEIIKYKVSEYITLKVIKTKIFGITIASTCYLSDEDGNIQKIF